ncbi:hypothetical protein IEQ34_010151 [Dendrobium chrysotoxum]|uniref:Mitochondrial glycoprotein n=1 Tax=Dendrobium chrysotoxum TaxID=161865 RepID=A0AAV7H2D3_DENCH|nr:hypothetical protein IEQ34_010151 [Dendrobium chrysotoxum]
MAFSISRPLFRREARLQLSLVLCARHRPILSCSSVASSSHFSSLVRSARTQNLKQSSSFLSVRFASSKMGADENLLKVLRSEIECIQEFKDPRELDVPEGFPFEILDNPGDNTITLKREFAGENIQIIVYMNPDVEEDEEEDDEDDDADQENASKPSISLHVTIDKGEEVPILEFVCNLNSDELEIENMKNPDDSGCQGTYEGPEFSDLDESLQKALHHYLKVRGISDSLYGFLSEYMMKKDEREYQTWLKNIEEFVRK